MKVTGSCARPMRPLLAALVLSCASASDSGPDDFAAALAAAKANLATAEGWEYDQVFGERANPPFRRALEACSRETRHPSRRPVIFLYRLDASGSLVDSMYRPSTNLADCVDERFRDFPALPPPPHADYWVLIGLGSHYAPTRPRPAYPPAARLDGREGYAVVEYTLTAEGKARDAFVVESTEESFGEAAVEAVSAWEYHPDPAQGAITEGQRKVHFLFCLHESVAERPRFEGCRAPRNRQRFVRELRERLDF